MGKAGCMFVFAFLVLLGSTASISGIAVAVFFALLGLVFYLIAYADIKISTEANAGNYVTGLPGLDTRINNIRVEIQGSSAVLYHIVQVSRAEWRQIGSIALNRICDLQVVNRSIRENRFGGMLGVRVGWAFIGAPVQRTIRQDLFYLIVSWLDGKFVRELILEFVGEGSQQKANQLADQLINAANIAVTLQIADT